MKQIFIFITLLLITNIVQSQSGTLDKSFGENGKLLSPFRFACNSLALQPDGKILAAGSGGLTKNGDTITYLLIRYNTNGKIDLNFGDSGRAIGGINMGRIYPFEASRLVVQPDGKIIAAGRIADQYQRTDVFIARFNGDGKLDESFGNSGTIRVDLGLAETSTGLALQDDGKVVVSGIKANYTGSFAAAFVLRFNTDGSVDNSFGKKGQVLTTGFGLFADVHGLKIYQDKILIGITEWVQNVPLPILSFVVLQYLKNGKIDSSYGDNGIARLTFPKDDDKSVYLTDILIQTDGKAVAAGSIGKDSERIAVARFTKDGFPDNSFGKNGYSSLPQNKTYSKAYNVFIQADNKIFAGGSYYDETNTYGAVRFLSNGTIDSTYGDNGVAATNILGNEYDAASCGFLQPDSKMLVGGTLYTNDENLAVQQGIVRFTGDLSQKQIIITKIKRWLQHHNGFTWGANNNVSSYVVQRSYDGITWKAVSHEQRAVSNTTVHYYENPSPLSGNNYYRLQTTNNDGVVNYSNVLAVNTQLSTINISPNPAKNVLHIEGLSSSNKTKLTVVDFSGNVKLQAVANTSSYNLNIASLATGNYLLKIETNDDVITKKFIKE